MFPAARCPRRMRKVIAFSASFSFSLLLISSSIVLDEDRPPQRDRCASARASAAAPPLLRLRCCASAAAPPLLRLRCCASAAAPPLLRLRCCASAAAPPLLRLRCCASAAAPPLLRLAAPLSPHARLARPFLGCLSTPRLVSSCVCVWPAAAWVLGGLPSAVCGRSNATDGGTADRAGLAARTLHSPIPIGAKNCVLPCAG